MADPKPPKGLGSAGERTWRAILAAVDESFELDERDLLLLREAARQADLIDRLEHAIASDGVGAVGGKGQPRISGVVSALVQARALFARLLAQIEIEPPAVRTGHLSGRQRDRLRRLQRSA